jgi:thiol-disulfide isomerase/thioredoxin
MTQEEIGPVYAPELEGGAWLQGDPVAIRGSGKPILIDFWDYTCVNCLRTLPYVKEWHRKYAELGLMVVGVHTPEFSFAKKPEHVRRAIASLGIEYPVVLDADFKIWQAYTNRYWPAKYFIDVSGKLRAHHTGEGGYNESEQALQALISEQEGFTGPLPELMEAVRPEDETGAVCYRVTPELYCGLGRGNIGNIMNIAPDQPSTYTDPGKHVQGMLYYEGDWILQTENAARPYGARRTSRMHLDYMGADLNLVLHPPITGETGILRVLIDGEPVGAIAGEDVQDGVVSIDSPRMYSLIRNNEVEQHTLTLETESDGLAAFAFTFTSCVAPPLKE